MPLRVTPSLILRLLFSASPVAFSDDLVPIHVEFINSGRKLGHIAWIPPEPDLPPRHEAEIPSNARATQNSFVGHRYQISVDGYQSVNVTMKRDGSVVFRATADGIEVEKGGALTDPSIRHSGPEWEQMASDFRSRCQRSFVNHSEDASYFCSHRFDHRLHVEAHADYTEQMWHAKMGRDLPGHVGFMTQQPQEFNKFTKMGFEVGQAPPDLLAELRAFYHQGRIRDSMPENHPVFDQTLSGRESDTWMLSVHGELKAKLEGTMKPIIAEWAGMREEDLQWTATYGIRLYHNSTVLHMHVDKRETHVLSAIIEVGHLTRLESPPDAEAVGEESEYWPLHIRDHSGEEHVVPNHAGQFILYESAVCPHGRPDMFMGREFANVFVHFSPTGWPDKYRAPTTSPQPKGFLRSWGSNFRNSLAYMWRGLYDL